MFLNYDAIVVLSKRRPVSEGGPVRKKSKQSPILPRVDPLNALVVLDIKKPPHEDNDHIIIPELKVIFYLYNY